MARRVPSILEPPAYTKKSPAITMIRNYTLLTPMFGGGVKPRFADELTPIRGSAIRGQLRFWWRATRGGQFGGNLEKMRAAEEAIFGCAASEGKQGPSLVQIRVENRATNYARPTLNPRPAYLNSSEIHEYVGFPLRPDSENGRISAIDANLLLSAQFTLTMTCQMATVTVENRTLDLKNELDATFWAWETFGGVGARTRRGFGAIDCSMVNDQRVDHPVSERDATRWVMDKLKHYVIQNDFPEKVPHLDPEMFIKCVYERDPKNKSAKATWEMLVSSLKKFRSPIQEKWPEAKVIRRLNSSATPSANPEPGFVRSEFGMPIIFHFAHDRTMPDASLAPQKFDRMASPLILRPLKCADGTYAGLAAFLKTPFIETIPLNLRIQSRDFSVSGDLYLVDETNLPTTLKDQERVIEAFISLL